MSYGVKLRVFGKRACFSSPEFKPERSTYPVMTPTAARGILEAIHWKPAINWVIDKIVVYKPIKYGYIAINGTNYMMNAKKPKNILNKIERGEDISFDSTEKENRLLCGCMILKDVEYVIEAHFDMTEKAKERDNPTKHHEEFLRHAKKGQCVRQPFFGMREFIANFELIENETPESPLRGEKDFGYILFDIDYDNVLKQEKIQTKFFHCIMKNGVIDIGEERKSIGNFKTGKSI